MKSIVLLLLIAPVCVFASELDDAFPIASTLNQSFGKQNQKDSLLESARSLRALTAQIQGKKLELGECENKIAIEKSKIDTVKAQFALIDQSKASIVNVDTIISQWLHNSSSLSARNQILCADVCNLSIKINGLLQNQSLDVAVDKSRSQALQLLSEQDRTQYFNEDNGLYSIPAAALKCLQGRLESTKKLIQESVLKEDQARIHKILQERKDALLLQWHQALASQKQEEKNLESAQEKLNSLQEKHAEKKDLHGASVQQYADKKVALTQQWTNFSVSLLAKKAQEDAERSRMQEEERKESVKRKAQERVECISMQKEEKAMKRIVQHEKDIARAKEIQDRQRLKKTLENTKKQEKHEDERYEEDSDLRFLNDQIRQNEEELACQQAMLDQKAAKKAAKKAAQQTAQQVVEKTHKQCYQEFLLQKNLDSESRIKFQESLQAKSDDKREELLRAYDADLPYNSVFTLLHNYKENLQTFIFDADKKALEKALSKLPGIMDQIFHTAAFIKSKNQHLSWYVSSAEYKEIKELHEALKKAVNAKSTKAIQNDLTTIKDQVIMLQNKLLTFNHQLTLDIKNKNKEAAKRSVEIIKSINEQIESAQQKIAESSSLFEKTKIYENVKVLCEEGGILNSSYLQNSLLKDYQDLPLESQEKTEFDVIVIQLQKMKELQIKSKPIKSVSVIENQLAKLLTMNGFSETDCLLLPESLARKSVEMARLYKTHFINKESLAFDIFESFKKECRSTQSMHLYTNDQINKLTKILMVLIESTSDILYSNIVDKLVGSKK